MDGRQDDVAGGASAGEENHEDAAAPEVVRDEAGRDADHIRGQVGAG